MVGADSQLYNYNGISHSGPTERMKRNLETNLAQVRQAAEKISASIRP